MTWLAQAGQGNVADEIEPGACNCARTFWHRLAVGLFLLIESEPRPEVGFFLFVREQLDRFGLHLHGSVEVTGFRVGGSQRGDGIGKYPPGQLAGFGC